MKISHSLLTLLVGFGLVACLKPPKRPTHIGTKNSNGDSTGTVDNQVESGETKDGGSSSSGSTGSGDGSTTTGSTPGDGSTTTGSTPGDGSTTTGSTPGETGSESGSSGPALETSERFDELVFLTTHNAFVNGEDAKWAFKNQSLSMQKQLDKGVTALMLDVYFEDPKGGSNKKPLLCHGECYNAIASKIPGQIPNVYLTMDLIPVLQMINSHLDKNKDAILTLFLEDYMTHDSLNYALGEAKGIKDKIFDPYKWDVMNKGWPRVDALKKEGKRLFIISDHSDKKDLGVAFAKDFTNENYWSLGKVDLDYSCKSRWDGIALNRVEEKFNYLFVMNHFRDIPTSELSRIDNTTENLWKRLNENCLPSAQHRPNFLAVDHFDEGEWGARKVVEELRTMGVAIFNDAKFQGAMKLLKEGKYTAKDFGFGDNAVDSIKVNAGFRVKVYDDDNFKTLIGEYTNDVRDLGDKINKASSIIVEKK